MIAVLPWLLVVEALAAAALPLTMRVFRGFPDRGFGVGRVLAIVLVGVACWLTGLLGLTAYRPATALVAALILGVCAVMAVFTVARRAPRFGALAGMHQSFVNVGANGKRLAVIALAAALATLLATVLGSGVVGPVDPAKAQGGANPLYLTTAVYPSPTNAIPVGTRIDFLIAEQNVTAGGRSARNVTVYEELPAGVTYVSAKSSQGSCAPMADEPVINCSVGTIRPGGVVHINVIAVATTRGAHTNYVYDSLGNTASAGFRIVRAPR